MNTSAFPEIAKAVQRGGKYIKRVPKPGRGYRYIYSRIPSTEITAAPVKEKVG